MEIPPPIPVIDSRDGGPLAHARARADAARGLREDCFAFFPRPFRFVLPHLDRLARRWLTRSQTPYADEIAAIAKEVGAPGVWFLNGSYQWGCTTVARVEDGTPWLARTLDWPFPGLGGRVELAWMQGAAGEFYAATWPGYVGVLTAMAPGRFAAAVNQAPMWRRTRHPWLRPYDMIANALRTWSIRHAPPDHLLRQAFETCHDFDAARRLLEHTPVARPVIYTLAGCGPGETCIIERTEESFSTRFEHVGAANDWHEGRAGWEGRMRAEVFFTCTYAEAAENSRTRRLALADWKGSFADQAFAWVAPPVLNPYTRIAVAMCPARGAMRVAGYEVVGRNALPQRVTAIREIAAAPCGVVTAPPAPASGSTRL